MSFHRCCCKVASGAAYLLKWTSRVGRLFLLDLVRFSRNLQ